jgi:REase_DpnII-MboI
MSSLKEILVDLNQRVSDLDSSIPERGGELEKILNNVLENTKIFEESWSGYWFKSYANLYFSGLQKPPESALFDPQHAGLFGIPRGWIQIDFSTVEKVIEEHCEISLDEIREEIYNQVNKVAELRDHLCVELSFLKGQPNFTDEVKELEELEKFEWGVSVSDFVHYRQPKSFVGSLTDIQRGLDVPPHIQYQATITHLLTKNSAGFNFIKRTKRIIRKIQIKENLVQEQPSTLNSIENIVKVCNSFHAVARQLRQRHSNRNTLTIEDEYDVQDLFHAILRIFFEDVRAEEWTPSYAGGSSRVDFLLPQEKIVIELKKTRNGLGAKEVGNQLLIDVARYQSHPDCKNLICFVYDPEGKIGNPKGLENDLNNLSSEKINIVTLVRPI